MNWHIKASSPFATWVLLNWPQFVHEYGNLCVPKTWSRVVPIPVVFADDSQTVDGFTIQTATGVPVDAKQRVVWRCTQIDVNFTYTSFSEWFLDSWTVSVSPGLPYCFWRKLHNFRLNKTYFLVNVPGLNWYQGLSEWAKVTSMELMKYVYAVLCSTKI